MIRVTWWKKWLVYAFPMFSRGYLVAITCSYVMVAADRALFHELSLRVS